MLNEALVLEVLLPGPRRLLQEMERETLRLLIQRIWWLSGLK